jgi:uncharacterized membrane protein
LFLVSGLFVFFAVHSVPASAAVRDGSIERMGANGYKLAFSALSLIGLVLIVLGYRALRADPVVNIALWDPPAWTRHVAFALMLPAMILLVASNVPSRIRTAAKHPMLLAIKIWALAHLIANGDLASVLLFASFLAYAVFDRISLKQRGSMGPLGLKTGGPMSDVIVVVAGIALYTAMLLWGHSALIGVALIG